MIYEVLSAYIVNTEHNIRLHSSYEYRDSGLTKFTTQIAKKIKNMISFILKSKLVTRINPLFEFTDFL
jgi:hypothetical protein